MSFDKLEDKILRTKYDIEQEFKDLKFLHQHPPIDNTKTIYNPTTLNGSFKHNFVVSLVDDLFIAFDHELFIPKSLSDFWQFYEAHKNNSNILIDSRAINYIAYAIVKYEEDILIYDVYTGVNISIYAFCSKFFNIQTNEITIHLIKQLFVGYLLFIVYAKSFNFDWSTSNVVKYIKVNETRINEERTTSLNIFDVLINCAKVKTSTAISTRNVYKIVDYFQKYFSDGAFEIDTSIDILNEWKLNNVKDYEFLIALTVLKNNDFHIAFVD